MAGDFENQADIFEGNLEALRKSYPTIAEQLDQVPPFRIAVKPADSGTLNLFVSDSDGSCRPLYPTDDPIKDIPAILDRLADIKGRLICLVGIGLGYHAAKIVERVGHVNTIIVYEAFPALLKAAMQTTDMRSLFLHPGVRWVVGTPVDLSVLLSSERDILFSANQHLIVEIKRITSLAPEWYETEKRRIQRFVQGVIISNSDMAAHGKRYFENRFRNLLAMSESIPLGALKGRMIGKPAIIVASGPSLSKNIEKLKDAKGKALILAADSAMAPMLQHGIMPDIVVSVDFNDFTFEKLAPFVDGMKEMGLLFIPEVTPKIPNYINFGFKIFTLLSPHSAPLFNHLLGTDEKPLMHAQSVVHLALGAAQAMGCDPIIFIGLDLAFDKEKDHAEGTILHWGNRNTATDCMVEDIYGKMVPTKSGLLNIRETCEILIRLVPGRTYIDATEGGAKIAGTSIQPLSEVVEICCRKPVAAFGLLQAGPSTSSFGALARRLEKATSHVHRLLSALLEYREFSDKIEKCLQETDTDESSSSDVFFKHTLSERKGTDTITGQMNDDPLIAALTDILAESADAYIEFEVQTAEAESSGDAVALFKIRFAQQRFVQDLREENIGFLRENISRLQSFLSTVTLLEAAMADDQEAMAPRLSLGTLFYDNNFLPKAELVFKSLPEDLLQAMFYLGCIQIRRGEVGTGLDLLEKAFSGGELPFDMRDAFFSFIEKEWIGACGSNSPRPFQKLMADRIMMLPSEKIGHRFEALNFVTAVADWLVLEGDFKQAAELLEKVFQTRFSGNAQIMARLLRLQLKTGEFDAGFLRLQEAVPMDPDTAVLWEDVGDMLFEEKDYFTAITAYEKYCRAFPERRGIFRKIGDCYSALGKSEAAQMAYMVAIGPNPAVSG